MVKKAFLLVAAAFCFANGVTAQKHCFTDEVQAQKAMAFPKIQIDEAELKAGIEAYISNSQGGLNKTTTVVGVNDTAMLYIPIVFHIVHDYGLEYITDEMVYTMVKEINDMYNARFSDTLGLINPYNSFIPGTGVRYKANARITFVLPTKDPNGNPTHGITRRRSYLSYDGGDEAKLDVWAPGRYMNVWLIRSFNNDHAGAAAYAYKPSTGNNLPWLDGVIGTPQAGNNFNFDNTLAHELGHTLNLDHPWGATNKPEVSCGDDDVDDTPPTKGHNPSICSNWAAIYDTVCAKGYSKTYAPGIALNLFGITSTNPVTIDYPDTTNAQNVMDYTYCSKMFSYLQAVRMRTTLRMPTAARDSLITDANLAYTGSLLPRVDILPTADFSIDHNTTLNSNSDMGFNANVFVCVNSPSINFKNRSWNDTITAYQWTFKNGTSTTNSSIVNVPTKTFTEPGWVDVSLTVTGNNTGNGTIDRQKVVYVSDGNTVNAETYLQDFTSADTSKYPIFNFYNNDHKWEINDSIGLYDHASMKYSNYDNRTYPGIYTNSPIGDYDDFYTPAFDFTQMTGNVFLNFFSAGAFRTTVPKEMGDTLQISYSDNCGQTWANLKKFSRAEISNNGTQLLEFKPTGFWNWQPQSILLPSAAKNSNKIFFRFRYRVGGDANYTGTGNNFYLDRIHFSNYTAAISTPNYNADGIAIAPNPTTGSSFVIIKDTKDKSAQIVVTDLTGKVVFSTEAALNVGSTNRIEIPANAIAVKGMYIVQITSETSKHTEKLVVY